MDPLGVAANIIAVLEISGRISSYCFQYIRSCKNAQSELLQLVREVGGLHMVLITLKNLAKQENLPSGTDPRRPPPYLSEHESIFPTLLQLCGPNGVLQACHEELARLEKKIASPIHAKDNMKTRKATVVHTLTWPFKAEDSRKILAEISRYMNTFTLALTVDEA